MNFELENKTIIVTGGASGLGAVIGSKFIQEGSNLTIFDLEAPSVSATNNGNLFCKGDVSNLADICHCIAMTEEKYGAMDVLINNAGIWPTSKVVDMTEAEWERVLRINLTGAFLFSKKFIEYLQANQRVGSIINIVSPVAFQGSGNGHSHYAAAKAGLVSFTRSLALEVAKWGIRVVAVAPGVMQTEMTKSTLDTKADEYLKRIPTGHFVKPDEVANVVIFMASALASAITGTTIDATGGMLGH